MLSFISQIFHRHEFDSDWSLVDCCELVADDCRTLLVRPLAPKFSSDDCQRIVDRLIDSDLDCFRRVCFDFSRVDEFVGAWSVHFALVIQAASKLRSRVALVGLHGQPANIAWLYRGSPEIRSLLSGRDSPR